MAIGRRCLKTIVALAVGLSVAAGCKDEPTDSAEVQPTWDQGQEWWIADQPTVDFADRAGADPYDFTRILHAFRLGDGTLITANFSNPPEIRAFATDGELAWKFGGEGEGPGEFAAIGALYRAGMDTLVAYDFWRARFTRLSTSGELLDVVNITEWPGGPAGLSARGRFDDGTLFGRPNQGIPRDAVGSGRSTYPAYRVGLDGSILDSLGTFEVADYRSGPDGRPTSPIFGKRSLVAVDGSRFYLGMGDDFVVRAYDRDGQQVVRFAKPHEPRPVTATMLDALKEDELERVRGSESESWRAQIESRYRDGPIEDVLPAYDRIIVDSGHNVWIRAFVAPSDSLSQWSVFRTDGLLLGSVSIPSRLQVLSISDTEVVGAWTDDVDVQTLQVYPLNKP